METNYNYDPQRRWLSSLKTANSTGRKFQDVSYSFDRVGNILSVENRGYKQSKQVYKYDDLYQLTEAGGTYTDPTYQALPYTYSYKQSYAYDEIGNMTRKLSDRQVTPDNSKPGYMCYDLSYSYDKLKPHQATRIGDMSYSYDGNGNLLTVEAYKGNLTTGSSEGDLYGGDPLAPQTIQPDTGKQSSFIVSSSSYEGDIYAAKPEAENVTTKYYWNEENRLTRVSNEKANTLFLYDAGGERTAKRGMYGETLYVSKLIQLQNRDVYTKHIFVGSSRIVSKLSNYGYGAADTTFEQVNTYYYHPDHLGSTSFVTDSDGEEYEHTEYAPYGETWVEEGDVLGKIGYSFTSKEKDEETGLVYFGARYYDARTSRWASVDPIIGEYLPAGAGADPAKLPGEGGIFNPVNLNLYHYAGNNPIAYNDPTGEDHRRFLVGEEGTRAHSLIGEYYKVKLKARGYENIRINKGMMFNEFDKRCYSRKRPDIRADRAGVKYIWEIKQNGVNGVNDSLDSLDMYNRQAVAAGDAPLIPGAPLEAVI